MPRAFLKRKVIIIALAAATVIGAGIWGWRAWQRAKDYARVEVSTAVSWQHRDFGSNGPASEVTITLKTPFHCPYADAEVVIETWTDDRGTNLLIPVLRPGEERYTWLIAVHTADKGDSGNLPDPEIVPTPRFVRANPGGMDARLAGGGLPSSVFHERQGIRAVPRREAPASGAG